MVAGAAATMVVAAAPAAAQTNPYSGTGYDISYPQCRSNTLPSGSFGIVGLNNGRPFTTYSTSCLTRLLAHATGSGMPAPSLYINTAYSGAYRKNVTAFCSQTAQSMAWQIGCSEADTSFGYAGRPATSAVTMWWLDVEVGNSWSTSNLALNRAAIQGATDRLVAAGFQVGVYSTQSSWSTITGTGFSPNGSEADWVAAGSCSTSFDGKAAWLSQSVSGGFDYDTAC